MEPCHQKTAVTTCTIAHVRGIRDNRYQAPNRSGHVRSGERVNREAGSDRLPRGVDEGPVDRSVPLDDQVHVVHRVVGRVGLRRKGVQHRDRRPHARQLRHRGSRSAKERQGEDAWHEWVNQPRQRTRVHAGLHAINSSPWSGEGRRGFVHVVYRPARAAAVATRAIEPTLRVPSGSVRAGGRPPSREPGGRCCRAARGAWRHRRRRVRRWQPMQPL